MEKKKIQMIVFALIMLGGIMFGYYKYVFSGQLSEMKQLKINVGSSQHLLDELKKISNDKQGILNETEKMKKEVDALDIAIPEAGGVTQFALDLHRNIKDRGLTVQDLTPQSNVTKASGYKSQEISINVAGKRQAVLDLMNYLQKNPRQIVIKDAMIRVKSADELEANMKAQIFYINED